MAGYTRQSTFADGDTITSALFNNEYNQILNAFNNLSGHKHDGTTGEGRVISLIGDGGVATPLNKVLIDSTNDHIEFWVEVSSSSVQQLYIADGAIVPVTDSDVDLGTSSLYFKNAYIDSITTTGNVAVGGNLTVTGTTTFNGGTITMGDAATDNVVFGADVNSNIIPNTDSAFDLGSSTQEWRDLYLDGTAHIDTLDVDVNATIAGTLGVTGVLTGTSLDISGDIDVDGTTNLDVVDIDGAVDMATTLAVAGNVDFNGDLDVDGTTNLDVVDIDGAVDMATTLTVGGEITAASLDISGNVDIDGVLETDGLSINGTTVTSTAAELNILDGVTSTATELNLLDGVTSTTAELNILDGVTASAADINLIDGITNGTVIASKAIVTDANIDITGGRNITISGELDAATLDISGNADIDGTLEADAITIAGVTLAETISDTVGAMVASNTETGITVTYDDADNTLDFVIGDNAIVQSMIADNAIDSQMYVDGSIDLVHMSANSVDSDQYVDGSIDTAHIADSQITSAKIVDGTIATGDIADDAVTGAKLANNIDIAGTLDVTGVLTADSNVVIAGNLTVQGDTTTLNTATLDVEDKNITLNKGAGDTSGSANGAGLTIQDAVDASNDATILWDTTNDEFDFSHPINVAGKVTSTGTSVFASLDISGDIDVDGTTNLDVVDIDGAVDMASTLNVTGAITGTLATAAQPNITSLGTLTGLTTTGDINFGDNDKAIFGAGSDLQIYHSGTNSLIYNSTGSLVLRNLADDLDIVLQTDDGSGNTTDYFRADGSTGEALLYYYGSEKLGTTSTGAKINEALTIGSSANDLGGTAGNQLTPLTLRSDTSNTDSLSFTTERLADGTDWTTAAHRIQRKVDATKMGYIQFGSSSTDTVTFGEGSTERMRIDGAGNLGLGTDSPDTLMEIVGADPVLTIRDTATGITNANATLRLAESGGSSSLGGYFDIAMTGQNLTFGHSTDGSADSEQMRLEGSTGDLALGTTAASGRLHVNKNGTAQIIALFSSDLGTNDRNMQILSPASDSASAPFEFSTSNSFQFTIDGGAALNIAADKNVGIGTASPNRELELSAATPRFRITDTDGGYSEISGSGGHLSFAADAGNSQSGTRITFDVDGSEKARIDASGNFGIGTTSLNGKLHIGSATATGNATNPAIQIGGTTSYRLGLYTQDERGVLDCPNGDDGLDFRVKTAGLAMRVLGVTGGVRVTGASAFGTTAETANNITMGLTGTNTTGIKFDTASTAVSGNARVYLVENKAGDRLSFSTGAGTEIFSAFHEGNVSIGSTTGTRKLTVLGSSTSQGTIYAYTNEIHTGTDTNAHVSIRSDHASASGDVLHVRGDGSGNLLTVDKSGTEVLVVDSSGDVGIGTSSPTSTLHLSGASPKLRIDNTEETESGIQFRDSAATGSQLAEILYHAGDQALIFKNGSSAERARIDNAGHFLVATTSSTIDSSNHGILLSSAARIKNSVNVAGGGVVTQMYGTDGEFRVKGDGDAENTNNAYGAISDERLKENITDATPKLEKLKQVQIKNYNLKAYPDRKQIGVVAQELEQVFPSLVTDNDDGYKTVKYSVFVPMLIKAMQEQQVIIDDLKTRIETLEE